MRDDRITSKKSYDAQGEEEETSEIGKTSGSEDVTAPVIYSVAFWIRIVKVVISFCMIQRQICTPSGRVRRQ